MDHAVDFDDHLPVLYRDDPAAGRALMAMVVGSRRRRRLQAGLVYAVLIALAVIFLFPLLWVLGLSLKTRLQVFADPPLFIWWPTLENYIDVLGRSDFLLAFVNTLVVAGSAVTLSLSVGVPAAYAFARFPFTGRSFLFFALLVMRMLPPIAVLVPMYVLFSKLGLATTRLSVVLAYSTFALPLVVWLMARLLRGSAKGTRRERLDRRRRPLPRLCPHRSATGEARHGGRRHPVPAAGVERFPLCRGADQQCHPDVAGEDDELLGRRFRRRLGWSDCVRNVGDPAGHHFLVCRTALSGRRTVLRSRKGLNHQP
jgi:hypothetical protein